MKPFDLEAAKRGDPIQCCGLSAKFIAYEPEGAPYQQVIYLGHGNQLFAVDCNGGGSHHTLTMAPKTKTVWVNLHPHCSAAEHFKTERDADVWGHLPRIGGKAYPVEIEE